MEELEEMLVDQLKDAHSAERQAIALMKKVMRKASDPELKEGLEAHLAQSDEHRERIERALENLGAKMGRKVCEAMRGLVEEAQSELEEMDKGPVMDIVIVASQQRIEHYEIAAYGTMTEIAKALGHEEVAELLGETLDEEKQQDEHLTEITREHLLPAAIGDEEEEDEDEDQDEDEDEEEEEEDEEADEKPPTSRRPARQTRA